MTTSLDMCDAKVRRLGAVVVLVAVVAACGGGRQAGARAAPLLDDALRIVNETKTGPEFKAVFGHEPSRAELGKAAQSVDALLGNGSHSVVLAPAVERMADQTMRLISDSTRPAITLVGHNEGGFLRFADGSRLSIEAAADGAPPGKILLILSCSANSYITVLGTVIGPMRRIAYEDTAAIERAFYSALPRSLDGLTKADLDRAMSDALATVSTQKTLTVVSRAAGVSTAAGGAYVYVETTR